MIDPGDTLPQALDALLRAERERPDPAVDARDRIFARLSSGLGLQASSGMPPSRAVPAPTSRAPASMSMRRALVGVSRRGLLTFLAGAAVGATVYGGAAHLAHRSEDAATLRQPLVARPAPAQFGNDTKVDSAAGPSSAQASSAQAPAPAATASHTRALLSPRPGETASASRHRDAGDGRDRGLAAERKLIEMARTALSRGQTDGALVSLGRHARLFPNGQLAEERESLYVQALVSSGAFEQARGRGKRFHRRYPQSLFAPVVDKALQSIP
jgi:TolA-binding protein